VAVYGGDFGEGGGVVVFGKDFDSRRGAEELRGCPTCHRNSRVTGIKASQIARRDPVKELGSSTGGKS
jgi:hypothetical protein